MDWFDVHSVGTQSLEQSVKRLAFLGVEDRHRIHAVLEDVEGGLAVLRD